MKKITIHCSDSDHAHHDNPETIRKWHVEERGWKDIGYHFVITKNGDIHAGRTLSMSGAHVAGHNKSNLGICLTGKYKFSELQFISLIRLVRNMKAEFNISDDQIKGHNDYDKGKTCPNFDYRKVLTL